MGMLCHEIKCDQATVSLNQCLSMVLQKSVRGRTAREFGHAESIVDEEGWQKGLEENCSLA